MIFVTGGTGFIGSHLLDRLSAAGQPVRALVRNDAKLPRGVEAVRGDLRSMEFSEALRGISTVIHLAGVVSAVRPSGYEEGNVRATENLARAAAQHAMSSQSSASSQGMRFVVVSSLAASGPCRNGTPVTEDHAPAPITPYGKTKLRAELAARAVIPDTVVVRPPVVYGPRDKGVYSILKPICQGIAPGIAGGERWFSMVYVDDLIDGILAAAMAPVSAGRTYFVSHPEPVSWSALFELTSRLTNRKPLRVTLPRPAAFAVGWVGETLGRLTGNAGFITREKVTQATQTRWVCDPRRAEAELGVRARTPIAAGLAQTLAWYKEAGWLNY
jgi:nucleoside-diphosphate-sugar epimerase